MKKMKLKQILDQTSVSTAVAKLATEIDKIEGPVAIVAILKGGAYVAYEILKLLDLVELVEKALIQRERRDIVIGHIGLESYGREMKSKGEIKLMTPLDLSRKDICGRTVVIVDDCVETSRTLEEAKKIIAGYEPSQICTAVLVDKVSLRILGQAEKPNFVGWSYYGDGFLVGCGMGYGERFRELSSIHEIVEEDT